MDWLDELHIGLDKRAMPEQVARTLMGSCCLESDLALEIRHVAVAHSPHWVSSMSEDFERPPDCAPQIRSVLRMFGFDESRWPGIKPGDPLSVLAFIDAVGFNVHWQHGMDWKNDRLDARTRLHTFGTDVYGRVDPLARKRQYNRHIRVLRHLEAKRLRMARALAFRRLVLIGRSGFAVDIPLERFRADAHAAAFIAYWISRKNRRRQFTLASKENPMDRLAAALLARCEADPSTDWAMIAMVHPAPTVLARLLPLPLGVLTAQWWKVMHDCAMELCDAWPGDEINLAVMGVRRGMDSSTWNTIAQAYNAARAGWLNCATAAGPALIEPFLPGKAMRLMAADLIRWHRASGHDVDPDTAVWASLPFPWDVIGGLRPCTRADVEAACEAHGVDPVARGWTAPRAEGPVVQFTPTPELVHGVTVADPQWAALLRRAGVFSGKMAEVSKAWEAIVLRTAADEAGVIEGPLPSYGLGGMLMDET